MQHKHCLSIRRSRASARSLPDWASLAFRIQASVPASHYRCLRRSVSAPLRIISHRWAAPFAWKVRPVDASLRFLARRPPRTGWVLFWLALVAVLILPWMLAYSALDLSAGPALLAVVAGLIFGLAGWRGIRLVLVVPALLLPFGIMDLLPPLYVVAADLRSLMHLVGHRPKFLLPSTVRAA